MSKSQSEVFQDDINELLDVLELGTHARTESPHHVLHKEIIPAIKSLKRQAQDSRAVDLGALANAFTIIDLMLESEEGELPGDLVKDEHWMEWVEKTRSRLQDSIRASSVSRRPDPRAT